MAYTERKTVSWSSRLGSSFRGILIGLILFLAGSALLWWNEGNFVATGDALNEAQSVTEELVDINRLDTAKNGKLVHLSGPAETGDILEDPLFGLQVQAIRLERGVEFYQWVEHSSTETKVKTGGEEETVTTYTYKKQWVSEPVNSAAFHDPEAVRTKRNTVLMTIGDFRAQAAKVSLGAYRLPEFLISAISGAEPLQVSLPESKIAELNRRLTGAQASAPELPSAAASRPAGADGDSGDPSNSSSLVRVSGNQVYFGLSPDQPRIGDIRVTFMETRPGQVSILAKLAGDTFEKFQAKNGRTFSRLSMGAHSAENMYGEAHSSNRILTWILRLAGAFLTIIGLKMAIAPLEVMASVLPPLGRLVGVGTGLVAFLLGLAWSLLIIAVAWLRFRPLIGISLVVMVAAVLAILYFKVRSSKAAQA